MILLFTNSLAFTQFTLIRYSLIPCKPAAQEHHCEQTPLLAILQQQLCRQKRKAPQARLLRLQYFLCSLRRQARVHRLPQQAPQVRFLRLQYVQCSLRRQARVHRLPQKVRRVCALALSGTGIITALLTLRCTGATGAAIGTGVKNDCSCTKMKAYGPRRMPQQSACPCPTSSAKAMLSSNRQRMCWRLGFMSGRLTTRREARPMTGATRV